MHLPSGGGGSWLSIAARSAVGKLLGMVECRLVTPGACANSRDGAAVVVTVGRPHAMASAAGTPNVALRDGLQ